MRHALPVVALVLAGVVVPRVHEGGKPALVVRDGQHEYRFVAVP